MPLDAFDPEILQDFLTESGELLEELEGDLVTLEETPRDPELLNKVFRALHTIKGSASFLGLTHLVSIAHAAESALNAARNDHAVIDRDAMNMLLEAVDTVRIHLQQIAAGEPLTQPRAEIVDGLTLFGSAEPVSADANATQAACNAEGGPASSEASRIGHATVSPLVLPENKTDLIEYLLTDLDQTLLSIDSQIAALKQQASRSEAADALVDLGESLARSAEFFEFGQMADLALLLNATGQSAADLDDSQFEQLCPRVGAIAHVLREQVDGLTNSRVITRQIDTLVDRVRSLIEGVSLDDDSNLKPDADVQSVLLHDGVMSDEAAPLQPNPDAPGAPPAPADTTTIEPSPQPANKQQPGTAIEQTIRVEVGRLETLMNLVGELVLQKNRLAALSRQIDGFDQLDPEFREAMGEASGTLDRVTGDIQVAVMRTRMQPLDKLFGKYPRLIRDLATKTGKKINLVIEGGETEVDKSILEELGDPMVHLLRNAADHGLELPEARTASGKQDTGTIRIVAAHEGSHVSVRIIDDGKGMSRDAIAAKAIENGIVTELEAAQLSDREVFRFIFAAGFSTADRVTDLSGRGVGMDVVHTNIEALKGTIDVDSTPGEGSVITIKIPLTIAIMPAMMVRVDTETYAIPLSNLIEIVRPESSTVSSIHGQPVLRLRDSILPLLSAQELFGVPDECRGDAPFAVVIQHNDRAFGLLVSELIGQQEIVIKPLDEMFDRKGPISGATVRDDGGVSLIVDVAQMARIAEHQCPE